MIDIDLHEFFRFIAQFKQNNSRFNVFAVVFRDMDPFDMTYYGTVRKIARAAGVGKSTAQRAMNLLCEMGLVEKVTNSVWKVKDDKITIGEKSVISADRPKT
jgi:DNA-binding MarR family transcriptional regulator